MRPPRQGFTLIELVIVMSMFATATTLTGMTFFLLMKSEKLVSQSFIMERTIARLAERFREDVHRSQKADLNVVDETSDSPNQMTFVDSEGLRIRYRTTKGGIARLTLNDETIFARDDFHLPDCHSSLAKGTESDLLLCRLIIERPGVTITRNAQAPHPLRSLDIRAHLNRRQFSASRPGGQPEKNSQETSTEDVK